MSTPALPASSRLPTTHLLYLHGFRSSPQSAKARLVAEQVAIARKQVDYHLARAQAAAASRVPGAKTALQPVVDGLVRVMRRVHADRQLQITVAAWPAPLVPKCVMVRPMAASRGRARSKAAASPRAWKSPAWA